MEGCPIGSYAKDEEYIDTIYSDINSLLKNLDDNFAVTLLKFIDKKGIITDTDCYKKANISRQTWYKIMNRANYRPSKETVISFAISLKLTLEETNKLLQTAGYALSNCKVYDVIIKYFITNKIYDVYTINEVLTNFNSTSSE